MKNKALTISVATLILSIMLLSSIFMASAVPPNPALLDPKTIPKYVNQLVANIPVYSPTNITDSSNNVIRQDYSIDMIQFTEQILPTTDANLNPTYFGPTTVWGYAGNCYDATTGNSLGYFPNSPSASFIATTGIPSQVTWNNLIDGPQFLPVDPTIHWANPTGTIPMNMPGTIDLPPPYPAFPPGFDGTVTANNPNGYDAQSPVPLVPHLHGGEVISTSDGGPDSWWTYNFDYTGPAFVSNVYDYPNAQNPATLWYHDHALGMTRLNVMSGLAGYYLLKDPPAEITTPTASNFDQYMTQLFPYGVSEIPLAIQDRSFYTNGQLWFPTVGVNPTINPYWMPEFFGNTIMVNGKVWPNLNVTQGWYRFRVLDGSNARFYTLSFDNKMPFMVIGSDGGYLTTAATVKSLTIAPGERYDILVDFSAVPVGTKIIMKNTARAPFPGGAPADPQTVGQVMQFTVAPTSANPGSTAPNLPLILNPTLSTFPTLTSTDKTRIRTLFEVMGPAGPVMVTVNGQQWDGVVSEDPQDGTTEDWVIVNLTGDTHPIHTHLATFQVLSRQRFQVAKYTKDWLANNVEGGVPPFPINYVPEELNPIPYLQGKATGPLPSEMGWKDTVQMNPGEVTIIRIRWISNTGDAYPFDPTQGPGYVWHCHIIDHEDNEMMRPYVVT